MPSGKRPGPPFLHVVGNSDAKPIPGGPDKPVEPGEGPTGTEVVPRLSALDQAAMELRLALMEIVQGRTYTGYHLVLHTYNPETDDETWEAITQGMTLKDLTFAAANMNARIQDLIACSHEVPPAPPE